MPYIDQGSRTRLAGNGLNGKPNTVGELTYALTLILLRGDIEGRHDDSMKLCKDYIAKKGEMFSVFAEVLGALDAARREYLRRDPSGTGHSWHGCSYLIDTAMILYETVIAPYEDVMIERNGDVYP